MNEQPQTEKPKSQAERPSHKVAPQNLATTKAVDRTPNGDTSRGVDTGAIEPGRTGGNGAAAG